MRVLAWRPRLGMTPLELVDCASPPRRPSSNWWELECFLTPSEPWESLSSQCSSVSFNKGIFGEFWNCRIALSCPVLLLPTSFASKNLHLYPFQQGHCGGLGPPPRLCYSLEISSVQKVRAISEFPILACVIGSIQSPLFVQLLPVYNTMKVLGAKPPSSARTPSAVNPWVIEIETIQHYRSCYSLSQLPYSYGRF